jgi:hypothetical protein
MIETTTREPEAGCNVVWLEIGQFFEYLLSRQTGCQEIEHVRDANPHAADTRATPALLRVHGNPIGELGHQSCPRQNVTTTNTDVTAMPTESAPFRGRRE